MGVKAEDLDQPKLTLSKLPHCKPSPQHMQTPPLRPLVSIPFHWEEAPGRPRGGDATKSKAARCLELPPRLLQEEGKMTMTPSPTTVLDGPYVGRSLSLACTFSFRKGPVFGREDGKRNMGSGRWGSFREVRRCGEGSMDFSQSLGDIFRSEDGGDGCVKITRVRRRKSFFRLSTFNSNSKYLWCFVNLNLQGDIYASFKQVVPWRRSSQ
ncbi:hypothetical protein SASPL_110815 [Salvia splendens]|uniref:Uncharacterized protein n=1 Tax=Salvia splendens TaxID=180675 RepID=A0A8X8YAP6_SALSN|nr:uncharacterized protein At4g00950-like isoform X1 [Salvia splendens]KAG6426590.1 hypothetical protein SASPL_110815 [Salvia splendens]